MARYVMINPGVARRPALLGDASSVQVESTDILNLGQDLRAAQGRINTLVASMQQIPPAQRSLQMAQDVNAQQQKLAELTTKYVQVYTAVFGQAPAGLGNPILIAAAVAVILSYIIAQMYLWKQKQDVLEAQALAAQSAENNRASIIQMAQDAQDSANAKAAAGDAAGAAADQALASQYMQQAGVPGTQPPPPPGTQSLTDWLKANWLPVAGVAAAIFIVPRLMER